MKTGNAESNSGKTKFNRGKPQGESWIKRRQAAIDGGTFSYTGQRLTKAEVATPAPAAEAAAS